MNRRVLAALFALVVLGGVAVGAATVFSSDGGQPTFEETSLYTFETVDTRCADAREGPDATVSKPVAGGRRLHLNETIAVDAHDTTLSASLDRFGPSRYVLDVDRDPGAATAGCDLSVRYNATLNVSTPGEFTLVITHEDRLVGTYYSEADSSGGSRSAGGGARESAAAVSDRDT